MVSSLKKSKKRIVKGIIISIVSAVLLAAILTKCIYDCTFLRYDAIAPVPAALEPMVKARRTVQFQSGKNTLTGYLYEGEREGLVVLVLVGYIMKKIGWLALISQANALDKEKQ